MGWSTCFYLIGLSMGYGVEYMFLFDWPKHGLWGGVMFLFDWPKHGLWGGVHVSI